MVPRSAGDYISHFVPGDQQRALCGASVVFGRVRSDDTRVASCKRCQRIYNDCCPLCRRKIKEGDATVYNIIDNNTCHEACARKAYGKRG